MDLAEVTVDTPSTDGMGDKILALVLENPKVIAVLIIVVVLMVVFKQVGAAVVSLVGKFAFPIGIIVVIGIAIAAAKLAG